MASTNTVIGYPNEFVSSKEKLEDKWALKYFRGAWSEMERDDNFNMDSRFKRFVQLRKISEGLDDISDIYKRFTKGDDTYMQVNKDVSTPLPKLARIAAKKVHDRPFEPKAIPVDSTSVSKHANRRNEILHQMNMEKLRIAMEQEGVKGIVPPPKAELPKSQEELDIHLLLNDKMGIAMAQEYLISQGFKQNNFNFIKRKLSKDLVDLKIAATKVYFDSDNNLKIGYVDPVRLVSSFVRKEDFSDARHLGEVIDVTISELREMFGDKYSEKDLQWIADNKTIGRDSGWSFGQEKYYNQARSEEEYNSNKIKLMYLQVKQYDKSTYIKKGKLNGGFRIEKKSYDYVTPKNAKREREVIHKGAQVIYEGYWVVGTDYVFDWKRKDDLFRERLNGKWYGTAEFDYTVFAPNIYDMRNKSMIEEARYYNELLINLELKVQQLLIQAAPPVTAYNVESLLSAMDAMGFDKGKPLEMANMVHQAGLYYFASKDEGGELISPNAAPIMRLPSGIDNSIMILGEQYNFQLAKMKEALGLPDAVNGSEPDKKALVGVQKLAAAGSQASMNDLILAFDHIVEETAKRVYMGFQTQIRNKVNIPEIEASIGTLNVEEVTIDALSKADFKIAIEMLPSEFEIEEIRVDLQRLAEAGAIAPEDKYVILRTAKESTIKAEAMMSIMTKKFRKEQEDAKMKAIQMQTQGNTQSAVTQAQEEAKNIQLKYDLELRNQNAKYQAEQQNIMTEYNEKRKTIPVEGEMKESLIEKAAEAKEGEMENEKESESKGYDLEKDTMPRGVEPSAFPSDANMKQSIGVPAT